MRHFKWYQTYSVIIVHIKPYRFLGEFQVISAWERKGTGEWGVKGKRCRLGWCLVETYVSNGDDNFTRESSNVNFQKGPLSSQGVVPQADGPAFSNFIFPFYECPSVFNEANFCSLVSFTHSLNFDGWGADKRRSLQHCKMMAPCSHVLFLNKFNRVWKVC